MELSIIVPIYNVEKYLDECLESIYKLDEIEYEVILVNDGSTDSSLEIAKKYMYTYNNKTKLVDKKNGGLSSARNAGLEVAQGEYVSFIDSDDIIVVDEYKKFFREGKNKKLDVMVGNMRYFMEEKIGEPLYRSNYVKNLGVKKGTEFFLALFEKKQKCFREEVVDDIYKREFLLENKLFFRDKLIHEDSLFTPLVYLKAERVEYIDRAFYLYRQRSGSIMSIVKESSITSLEKICNLLLEEYDKTDNFGKEALSKLIPSFYKVVLFRYIGMKKYSKEKLNEYRKIYRKLNGIRNGVIEEILVYISPKLVFNLRKLIGKEISCKQNIPKF